VNTVSTHIRGIYAKLGADDRSAAVRRARELRLLAAVRSEHSGARERGDRRDRVGAGGGVDVGGSDQRGVGLLAGVREPTLRERSALAAPLVELA
jgi:hypothetical protein